MVDDLDNLRNIIAEEKQIAEMRQTFIQRKLDFGGSFEEIDNRFEARLRNHFDNMSDLVHSDVWSEIQQIRQEIEDAYKVPPTAKNREYVAYSIVRDVLGQFFTEIENRAKRGVAKDAEIKEEVINIDV